MRRESVEHKLCLSDSSQSQIKRFSIIEKQMWNGNLLGAYFDAYDHTTLNAPVPVRSPKLSSVGPDQYLDG